MGPQLTAASFDSNILIDALAGIDAARDEIRSTPDRWISRITWIEVMVGAKPATSAVVERFLNGFAVDEVTEAIARRAATIRRMNTRIKLPDAVIWASAQLNGRLLVTRNTRDFAAGTPGIHVPYTLS